MKKLIFLVLSFIVFGCSLPNDSIDFYVDVNGDDSNQGTLKAPFKTIVQAKNAIRALSEQQRQKNINATHPSVVSANTLGKIELIGPHNAHAAFPRCSLDARSCECERRVLFVVQRLYCESSVRRKSLTQGRFF